MVTKTKPTNKRSSVINTDSEENILSKALDKRTRRPYLFILIGVVIVLAFYFKQYVIAAVVNNKPILRTSVIKELESQGGKQALDALITQELIRQEAQKRKVNVSDEDVNKKLAELDAQFKTQNQTLDKVLESQGLTREGIKSQIRVQIMLEKLLGDKIKITDKEVEEAYKEQKEIFAEEKDLNKVKATIKDTLRNQKLSTEAQNLIQELKKNAKISYFVSY